MTWFPPYGVLYIPALSWIHDTHSVSNDDWSVGKNASLLKNIYHNADSQYTVCIWRVKSDYFFFGDVTPQGACGVYTLANFLVLIFISFLRELSHNKLTNFCTDLLKLFKNTISCYRTVLRRNSLYVFWKTVISKFVFLKRHVYRTEKFNIWHTCTWG